MTRLLVDAVLIVGVTASLIAAADAFDSLGHRAPPAPRLDQPSLTGGVQRAPDFPVPEGGIVITRRVIVRVEATPRQPQLELSDVIQNRQALRNEDGGHQ